MRKWQIRGAAVILLLLLMAAAGGVTAPVYYLNDDVTMRSIVSGAYTGTPDGHAVYMKYPLTFLLAGLYRLSGGLGIRVPWFDLLLAGCILLAGAGILIGCWEAMAEKGLRLQLLWGLTGVLVFAGLLLPQYLYLHYTIVAALLAGSALFLWGNGSKRGLSLVLLGLCYLVRSQVFFLSLPFLLVAVLDGLLRAGKAGLRQEAGKQGRALLLLAVMTVLFWGIHSIGYGSEAWQSYEKYNDSRTALYDYTDFLSTDRYQESYEELGLTWEQYLVLSYYDTMLDPTIDAGVLDQAVQQIREQKEEVPAGGYLKHCLQAYYRHARYDGRPYSLVWLGCYGILVLLLVFHKNWVRLLLTGALAAGRSLIWIYLIAQGRFPERIWISLYLLEILLLMGMLLRESRENGGKPIGSRQQWLTGGVAVLCLALFGAVAPGQLQEADRRAQEQRRKQTEWEILTDSLEEQGGTLYLMDVFSAVAYAGKLYEADDGQVMLLGGWLTRSPLAQQRLAQYGAGDAAEALLRPGVYLAAAKERDMTWLQSYLEKRLGEVRLQERESIACGEDAAFVIYQLIQ
ncbi:MAG: hypothetical protein J6B43_08900 [Lachnospiraceae bacterium]|nr:hypothetical protein [Lachnospiraceae bacterium]